MSMLVSYPAGGWVRGVIKGKADEMLNSSACGTYVHDASHGRDQALARA